jgi:hypothetical protein
MENRCVIQLYLMILLPEKQNIVFVKLNLQNQHINARKKGKNANVKVMYSMGESR